jgi:hypothetical protein
VRGGRRGGLGGPDADRGDLRGGGGGGVAAVARLRVALAHGDRVVLRTVVVATGGRHRLLEGDRWQRAVPAFAAVLERRVTALLALPGDG